MIAAAVAIATARLDLVPLAVDDAAHVVDALRDPAMHRYLQEPPAATVAELEARFARWCAGSPDPHVRWLNWTVRTRAAGTRIGLVQATIDTAARSATIAYRIFTRHAGNGYAREAAAALVAHLAALGTIERIVAEISEPNRASRRIVERLGFARTGTIPGAGRDGAIVCDDAVYEYPVRPGVPRGG